MCRVWLSPVQSNAWKLAIVPPCESGNEKWTPVDKRQEPDCAVCQTKQKALATIARSTNQIDVVDSVTFSIEMARCRRRVRVTVVSHQRTRVAKLALKSQKRGSINAPNGCTATSSQYSGYSSRHFWKTGALMATAKSSSQHTWWKIHNFRGLMKLQSDAEKSGQRLTSSGACNEFRSFGPTRSHFTRNSRRILKMTPGQETQVKNRTTSAGTGGSV